MLESYRGRVEVAHWKRRNSKGIYGTLRGEEVLVKNEPRSLVGSSSIVRVRAVGNPKIVNMVSRSAPRGFPRGGLPNESYALVGLWSSDSVPTFYDLREEFDHFEAPWYCYFDGDNSVLVGKNTSAFVRNEKPRTFFRKGFNMRDGFLRFAVLGNGLDVDFLREYTDLTLVKADPKRKR